MTDFSRYLEDALLNHIFRGSAYTAPTKIAVALLTENAVDTDTGSLLASSTGGTGVEVSNANNYSRVAVNPSTANWEAVSAGVTSNSNAITFPTASGSWGTITGIALLDSTAHGAGNILYHSALDASKAIGTNDVLQLSSGSLTITHD